MTDQQQHAVVELEKLQSEAPWQRHCLPHGRRGVWLGVGFRVIELDDIDSNDIGSQTLPPHDQLAADPGLFVVSRADPNGDIRGSLHVHVDDGTYDVQVSVTTWDEQF